MLSESRKHLPGNGAYCYAELTSFFLRGCSHRRKDSFVSSRPSFVGGVNTTADMTRQFFLVSNCVHTADAEQTRQFCLVRVGEQAISGGGGHRQYSLRLLTNRWPG